MSAFVRDRSVSVTKGVAIILMVLVHARFSHYGDTYVNMFHMPLFFFMSGYCFKEAYLNDFKNYAIKRIKGSYLPFIKWGLLFLLLHNVFYNINIYNGVYGFQGVVSELYTIQDYLRHAVLIVGSMQGEEQLIGGYWFLHTYFFAVFISFVTIWLFRKNLRLLLAGGGVLLIIGLLMAKFSLRIPYYIKSREILASAFIVTGFAYRYNNWKLHYKTLTVSLWGAAIVAVGALLWPCSMLSFTWKTIIPYYFSAIAGTLMVFACCKCLSTNKLAVRALAYIGDKTLDILTWHFLSFKIVSICMIFVLGLQIERLAEFPVIEDFAYKGWWVAYFVVGLGVSLLMEYFIRMFENRAAKLTERFLKK